MAGDAAPTTLGISVGGRLDRMTIEISAQEFGARAYMASPMTPTAKQQIQLLTSLVV